MLLKYLTPSPLFLWLGRYISYYKNYPIPTPYPQRLQIKWEGNFCGGFPKERREKFF